MAPLRKPLTVALVLAMVLSSFVLIARPVAAAQNHPTWTQGDFWVYTRTAGSATSTIRIDVYEKSTLTLPLGSYDLWHITTTTTDSNGNSAVVHSWVQDSNLGTAKTTINLGGFGTVTVTYDPPLADAVFPLSAGASWSLSTTLRVVNTTFTFPIAYTAAVTTEQSTSVIAGSFNVAVISRPCAQRGLRVERDEDFRPAAHLVPLPGRHLQPHPDRPRRRHRRGNRDRGPRRHATTATSAPSRHLSAAAGDAASAEFLGRAVAVR